MSVHGPQKWYENVYTGIVENELVRENTNVEHTSSSFRPHAHLAMI